ncbi:MAG: S8 family serine peptidase [Candidatus Daviesbacteria bacterium]|nr:S8 family serine peptidase [Candidatus Daviesbacteria bacterium]
MPNNKGFAPILILLAALGIIIFLLISSTAPFKDKLFSLLYPKPSSLAQGPSVPDEILIKFKAGVNEKARENVLKAHGLEIKETIPAIEVILAKVPEQAKDKVIEALSHNPSIEYAEPNSLAQLLDTPNDPYYTSNTAGWALKKIGASGAWDISKGSASVIVAVIDSGAFAGHEDFVGKILPGYNFVNSTTDTSDTHGHGTGVTGVIGAVTNNGKGNASLGREVSLMPLKVVAPDGSISTFNIANAIMYGADHGVKVINVSLGNSSPSSTEQEAVNYAWNKGVVLVAAAGNNGTLGVFYPAAADNVIAVGATDSTDSRWTGSNYGPQLDVVAPGVGIYSPNLTITGYSNYGGTSYAAPHVAALAALIMSANPGLINSQVVDIITSTALDLGDPGWDQYFGFGRINAGAALQKATGSTAPPPDTTAPTVSITAPSSGSTVSGPVDINVDASDNVGVTKVDFYVDGVLLGSDISSPYVASLDTISLVNGSSHNISAKAYDLANNVGTSSTVTVTVNNPVSTPTPTPVPTSTPAPISSDTTPPTVSITSPLNGATVKAASKVNVSAAATDNVKIAKVEFYVGGSLKCTSTLSSGPYSCTWPVPGKKNTSYIITVKAYDSSNNSTPVSITVKTQ